MALWKSQGGELFLMSEVPLYLNIDGRICSSRGVHKRGMRAKREQLKTLQGLSPERQGRNLAMTVLYVPH